MDFQKRVDAALAQGQTRPPGAISPAQLTGVANGQLDALVATGQSPVEAVRQAADNWDRDQKSCSAAAKTREAENRCHDMVVHGNAAASNWLNGHQRDGEIIYGLRICVEVPGVGNRCNPEVAFPGHYQSNAECQSVMTKEAATSSTVSTVACVSRAGKSQYWVVVDSRRGLTPMRN